MKEIVYISGPIAGFDREERMKAFAAAEKKVKERWLDPIIVNPMKLEEPLDQTWEGYLRRDLQFLRLCSGMYVLSGWQKSRGSLWELHYALGELDLMPIVFENPWSVFTMKENGKILSEEKALEYFEDLNFVCSDDLTCLIQKYGAFRYFLPSKTLSKKGTMLEITFNPALSLSINK